MKLSKYILLLAILTIWSCKQEPPKPEYTIVSGTIENTQGGELTIMSRSGFEKATNVKDDGTFTDTLNIDDGVFNIRYGKAGTSLYISKGSNINLTADEKDFAQSLQYTGDYAEINNYYAERGRIENKFMFNAKDYCEKEEPEFIKMVVADKKLLEDKLEAITNIPQDIKEKEKRHLYYKYLQNKYMYQAFYHGRYANKEDYKASEEFMKELNNIPQDRPEDYKYSGAYNYLITFVVVGNKAYKEYEKNKEAGYGAATNKAALELENTKLRDLVLFDNTEMRLPMSKNKKEIYDNYMKVSSNQELKDRITKLYNYLSALEPGKPSPKFVNYENYAGGTTSLDDLKGRYVYIDVWATWCGPCKYEIPFLEKVEKQYHDKNIEFVSISVDNKKDHGAWKEMIAEKEMTGTQLFADKAFNSDFIQAYKIRGIPQFILLDPEGNIVQVNAPRPSDEKLIELFNSLGI